MITIIRYVLYPVVKLILKNCYVFIKSKELGAMYCIKTQEFSCKFRLKKCKPTTRDRNKNHNKQLIVFVSCAPLFCHGFAIFLCLLRTLSCLVACVCIFLTVDLPHVIFIRLQNMRLCGFFCCKLMGPAKNPPI
jgi:hypothetical protein